jgi:hypothetical protein
VGIHETILGLRSGFQTMVGDSSGVIFTKRYTDVDCDRMGPDEPVMSP